MEDNLRLSADLVERAHLSPNLASGSRPSHNTHANDTRVQQPQPQALPSRTGPSSILVSPRQKGNPILNNIRALPWEYSDIPADFVLGITTCALFLSLKYHRLHPEYIYSRIRALAGKYKLRILLTMVDIQNHEESLKELSKTSLINDMTVILCWSAQEASRYLELFKSYEHAAPTSIKAQHSTTYSEKLVAFVTVPRSINKTDAIALVSSFGSLRTAANARPEEVALVPGWGGKKVQRWCGTVQENFRVKRAAKRGLPTDHSRRHMLRESSQMQPKEDAGLSARLDISGASNAATVGNVKPTQPISRKNIVKATSYIERSVMVEPDDDEEEALLEARVPISVSQSSGTAVNSTKPHEASISPGITIALERLRRQT